MVECQNVNRGSQDYIRLAAISKLRIFCSLNEYPTIDSGGDMSLRAVSSAWLNVS